MFPGLIPKGFGKMGNTKLPHMEETNDPGKIFTADFLDEEWKI
jgi:hypothetical protein